MKYKVGDILHNRKLHFYYKIISIEKINRYHITVELLHDYHKFKKKDQFTMYLYEAVSNYDITNISEIDALNISNILNI